MASGDYDDRADEREVGHPNYQGATAVRSRRPSGAPTRVKDPAFVVSKYIHVQVDLDFAEALAAHVLGTPTDNTAIVAFARQLQTQAGV